MLLLINQVKSMGMQMHTVIFLYQDVLSSVPEAPENFFLIDSLESTPLIAAQLKKWTHCDLVLSKLVDLILHGWQFSDTKELKPYQHC